MAKVEWHFGELFSLVDFIVPDFSAKAIGVGGLGLPHCELKREISIRGGEKGQGHIRR
jgi:hypothetical protein